MDPTDTTSVWLMFQYSALVWLPVPLIPGWWEAVKSDIILVVLPVADSSIQHFSVPLKVQKELTQGSTGLRTLEI